MPENALALIQAKIAETEDKLAKLRVTEHELSKLSGGISRRSIGASVAKRGRPKLVKASSPEAKPQTSLTSRLRDYLKAQGPSSAPTIAEGLGVETRPISFALQALKRKGEVKSKDGEWLISTRRS